MTVNEDLISKLEKLSKLKIEDKSKMVSELEEVVSFMENINTFDKDTEQKKILNIDIFREDIPVKNGVFGELQKEFIENDSFMVPKIIE